jgi:hypothetical protein
MFDAPDGANVALVKRSSASLDFKDASTANEPANALKWACWRWNCQKRRAKSLTRDGRNLMFDDSTTSTMLRSD